MKSVVSALSLVLCFWLSPNVYASEKVIDPEVRFADSDGMPPKATLEDMAWFEGIWVGTVFGGPVEHRVMPPHDGHMPGLVRLRSGETDEVFLYELSSFSEVEGTLTYRNRLFDPALQTVGEEESVTDRPLVAVENGIAYFDGITFASNGMDKSIVAFVLPDADGRLARHVVRYHRKGDDTP